jgi:hypothetical protein
VSTESNNCNRGATTSQIHGFVFVSMSTLSTAINTSQHLSTKALASNNSVKGHYLGICYLLKPHQPCQQTATTATELPKVFVKSSTLSTTINTCQHLSTKALASSNFIIIIPFIRTISLSLLALKTTSTMSTDSNNCNRGAMSHRNMAFFL